MRSLLCGFSFAIFSLIAGCGLDPGSGSGTESPTMTGNVPESSGGPWRLPQGYLPVSLKSGAKLDTYGDCGVYGPECPAHTACSVVFLDSGTVGPSCVAGNICDLLSCGGNNCTVLDSYPGQVICAR